MAPTWRAVVMGSAVAVVVGVVIGMIIDMSDDEVPVAARAIGDVSIVSSPPGDAASDTAPAPSTTSVPGMAPPPADSTRVVLPGLVEVSGVLGRDGDDLVLGVTVIDGPVGDRPAPVRLELDAGPDGWVRSTIAPADVDGDGIVATWWEELNGLVGRQVTVLGLVDDGDLDVFDIAGVTLRPPYSEAPPWADDWNTDRLPAEVVEQLESGITGDQAVQTALALVPGVVIDAELYLDDDRPYWEVEVRATDGAVYDVEIDALTGTVVELERR